MSTSEIALFGAPDALLGTPQAKSNGVQAMQFTMTNEILEELLDCVRNGKPPQILFGHNPVLRYNGKSHTLEPQSDSFRHEIYSTNGSDDEEWKFAGVVNHSLSIQQAEDHSAGLDAALETLKNRVAAEKMEREANKAIISTPDMRPLKSRGTKSNHLKPPPSLSQTSSPALPASKSPSYLSPPKSAPLENMFRINPKDPAIRRALILFLSFEPRSVKDCRAVIGTRNASNAEDDRNIKQALKTIAMCNDPANIKAKWTLLERSYKELRPYDNFRWPTEKARETALDNAIRAYDRMRIPPEDTLWQTLLPKEHRGKGLFLSRLKIQEPAAQARTPAATPLRFDKKTGLPKKSETKKEKEKEGRSEKEDKPKKASKAAGGDPLKPVKESFKTEARTAPTAKPINRVEREDLKPKSPAVGVSTPAGARPRSLTASSLNQSTKPLAATSRDVKPSTAAKSLLNKPKNPSPLSKSPPVNASDLEDSHPVHKKLSAAVSPAKKRKLLEANDRGSRPNGVSMKRQHLDSPKSAKASISNSSAEKEKQRLKPSKELTNGATAPLKRKAVDMDSDSSKMSTPTKARKIADDNKTSHANGFVNGNHGKHDPSRGDSGTSSEDSGPIRLTWKQALDMAVRYEQYYPLYQKLWTEIVNSDTEPTQEKREQLQKMHNKLKVMKEQIGEASWRGSKGAES